MAQNNGIQFTYISGLKFDLQAENLALSERYAVGNNVIYVTIAIIKVLLY